MLSANPLLVMALIPVLTFFGCTLGWGVWPRPCAGCQSACSLPLFLTWVVAMLQARIDGGARLSILWQFLPYTILTIAEVLVSTTGLEFAFREAAPEMKSIVMGFWSLTVTMGNLVLAGLTKALADPTAADAGNESVSSSRFLLYAGVTLVVAVLFSLVAAFYRYRDEAAAQGR